VVPLAHDQFDNAARVKALGAGAGLPASKLDAARLARTLARQLGDGELPARCAAIAQRFASGQAMQDLCVRLEALAQAGKTAEPGQ
jgi:rhamnosyltransferase subunit B